MDTMQILLIITLGTTTVFSVVVGIQLILVLKEFKKTLQTINKITTGFESIGVGIEKGFEEISGFMNGFKALFKLFEIISPKRNDKK
ncbi:MAG: hypothetical protein WAV30_03420 [Microgenomates group bacterium]